MYWSKLLAAAAVALLTVGAIGAAVGLVDAVLGSVAALAVVGLLVAAVLAAARWGTSPNRWLSNPYWG